MNDIPFYHPSWPIIYEDNHLLGLYKPAGLLVQADRTKEVSLLEMGKLWLKRKYGKPGRVFLGMVHRLDRPVAGVILFCRTSKAAARVSAQFRNANVHKRYLAVVEGKLKESSGRLVHFIERREGISSRIVPPDSPGSREARLVYQVLDTMETKSLVEVQLETGRRHQIRLQLAHIGNPILGDLRYGASTPLDRKQIGLLAVELGVTHPIRNELLVLRSPLPRGWPWPVDSTDFPAPFWNWAEYHPLLDHPVPGS